MCDGRCYIATGVLGGLSTASDHSSYSVKTCNSPATGTKRALDYHRGNRPLTLYRALAKHTASRRTESLCMHVSVYTVRLYCPLLLRTPTESVGDDQRGRMLSSVCLSVCPQHNSKTNDPKVFKLSIGMTLGYLRNDVVLVLKVKGQGHRVDKFIFRTNDYYTYMYVNAHVTDNSNSNTAWDRTLSVPSSYYYYYYYYYHHHQYVQGQI